MYRGSRHLSKITGPYSPPTSSNVAARVRNESVEAGASSGQSWNVQSGRYNKPPGCSTSVACRGRPWKQTNKLPQEFLMYYTCNRFPFSLDLNVSTFHSYTKIISATGDFHCCHTAVILHIKIALLWTVTLYDI
jgi:hypothetical protein